MCGALDAWSASYILFDIFILLLSLSFFPFFFLDYLMLTCAHINARSLLASFDIFKDYFCVNSFDLVAVSETWLTGAVPTDLVLLEGYTLLRRDRLDGRRAGGVAIYLRNDFKYSLLNISVDVNFEHLWIKLFIGAVTVTVGVVYRPPSADVAMFIDGFEDLLSRLMVDTHDMVILGDFNINLLGAVGRGCLLFNNMCDALGFKQIITDPTREVGSSSSLLDFILIPSETSFSSCGVRHDLTVSDHYLTYVHLVFDVVPSPPRVLTFRDFSHFHCDAFVHAFESIDWQSIYSEPDINMKLTLFNCFIINLFDVHAPYKTITFRREPTPWLTDTIKLMMRFRDRALRRARVERTAASFNYYKQIRNLTTSAIRREKRAYLNYITSTRNSKLLWNSLKTLNIYNRRRHTDLPAHLRDVNDINNHFFGFMSGDVADFDTINFYRNNTITDASFSFRLVSTSDVATLLASIKSQSLGADDISIRMLLLCGSSLLPVITHLINTCLLEGVFPDCWKIGIITPLPKVSKPTQFKDLRPISILPVLSKLLEKIVSNQIREYLDASDILPIRQSGFRGGYSCETAMAHIVDDILRAIDDNQITTLVLLDYSRAFDTLNHSLLLAILHYIGFGRDALNFFSSYLTGRRQVVSYGGSSSPELPIISGVPQGSILGPLLYTIYTSKIIKCLRFCNYHLYADDTQLYYSFPAADACRSVSLINEDILLLEDESSKHCLHINGAKSCVLVFGRSRARLSAVSNVRIKVANALIPVSDCARNLGLYLDTGLRFKEHVSRLVRLGYSNLKLLYGSRACLGVSLRRTLCEALILCRFNFCLSVYYHCLDMLDKTRIQRLQNSCLRFIYGIGKYSRISHALDWAGWINMSRRAEFYSTVFFYKIIYYKKPSYLYRKVLFRTDVHNVNVRSKGLLTPPFHHLHMFRRSYSYNIVRLLNAVPSSLRSLHPLSFARRLRGSFFLP